jgi:hypothetical protein
VKRRATTLLLLYLVCAALTACRGALTTERLRWRTIGEGRGVNKETQRPTKSDLVYLGREPRLLIVDHPLAVPSLKLRVHPRDLERVAETNLDRFWVAAIYQGRQGDTNYLYSIQVRRVQRQENTVYIHTDLQERYVGASNVTGANWTPSPYLVLRIRKPAGMTDEPSFVLNTDTQIVPQLCAISGEYVPWDPIASESDAYSPHAGPSPSLAIVQTPDEAPPDQPPSYYSPATGISLRTHFGVVAYQGEQPTTEHGIDVISVKRQDETVLVCAQFISPRKGPPDVVYPYYLFQVERTSELKGRRTFLLLDDGVEVAGEVAVIR